jgi:hypothetical protein
VPRKSAASLAIMPTPTVSRRMQAPSSLGNAERKVWDHIISTTARAHWVPSDSYLLVEYCRAIVLADRAWNVLADVDADPLHAKAAVILQEKSVRAMCALAHKLRVSPQSRQDRKRNTNDPRAGVKRPWGDDARY